MTSVQYIGGDGYLAEDSPYRATGGGLALSIGICLLTMCAYIFIAPVDIFLPSYHPPPSCHHIRPFEHPLRHGEVRQD